MSGGDRVDQCLEGGGWVLVRPGLPPLVEGDGGSELNGASPCVVDALILDLLDPEEAKRPPMAMKGPDPGFWTPERLGP